MPKQPSPSAAPPAHRPSIRERFAADRARLAVEQGECARRQPTDKARRLQSATRARHTSNDDGLPLFKVQLAASKLEPGKLSLFPLHAIGCGETVIHFDWREHPHCTRLSDFPPHTRSYLHELWAASGRLAVPNGRLLDPICFLRHVPPAEATVRSDPQCGDYYALRDLGCGDEIAVACRPTSNPGEGDGDGDGDGDGGDGGDDGDGDGDADRFADGGGNSLTARVQAEFASLALCGGTPYAAQHARASRQGSPGNPTLTCRIGLSRIQTRSGHQMLGMFPLR